MEKTNFVTVLLKKKSYRKYYIDFTNGNDSNPGTISLPMKTITKVNSLTLKPGESVLFKRGESWSGIDLICSNSGSGGKYITYNCYGNSSLALPVITGANTANQTMKADTKHHINIKNLNLTGTVNNYYCLRLADCHDVYVSGCLIHGAGVWYGLYVSGINTVCYNISIMANEIYSNKKTGLEIGYNNTVLPMIGPANIFVIGNSIHNNGTVTDTDHGIYLRDCTSGLISGNICYSNTVGSGIKVNTSTGLTITKNKCYLNKDGFVADAEYTATTTTVWSNNFAYNNTSDGLFIIGPLNGGKFYNNNLINNNSKGLEFFYEVSGWIIKNNIIFQDRLVTLDDYTSFCIEIGNGATQNLVNNTLDYNNLVYSSLYTPSDSICHINATRYNITTWRALSGNPDAHSSIVNPTFVTNYTNLHLQNGSGIKTAGINVSISNDFDGVVRNSSTPSIGAYEFV